MAPAANAAATSSSATYCASEASPDTICCTVGTNDSDVRPRVASGPPATGASPEKSPGASQPTRSAAVGIGGATSGKYGVVSEVSSGTVTTVTPATNASTMAFLPKDVASAASEENNSRRTANGLVAAGGGVTIESRKASSSMPTDGSVPAERATAGIRTSALGATTGLATTTPATTNATPVDRIGPIARRTAFTAS